MSVSIREIMTKDPITIDESSTVVEAAKAMQQADIGPALITSGDKLRGILTDRDIVVRVVAEGQDPGSIKAIDIATTNVQTISPDAEAGDAVRLIKENNIRRIVVAENDQPIGIVSIGDLAVALDEDSVLADISSEPPNN